MSSGQSRRTEDDAPTEVALHKEFVDEASSANSSRSQSQSPPHGSVDFETALTLGGTSKDAIKLGNAVFRICDPNDDDDDDDDGGSILGQVSALEKLPNLEEETVGGTPRPPTHALPFLSGRIAVILYLSAFAIIGSSLRTYLGRIFGYDCEFPPEQWDYLHPLSTCLTATGLTEQNGGALFIDLPANMLGSLLMGVMTPVDKNIPVLPWLLPDHRLQNYDVIHLSLRTALCGSLTTFASWNTQMIVMMAGHETVNGSPQIVQAIFGYIIGLNCAVASFQVGRHLGKGLYSLRKRSSSSSGGEEDDRNNRNYNSADNTDVESQSTASTKMKGYPFRRRRGRRRPTSQVIRDFVDVLVHGKYSPFVFASLLLALFFIGDFKMDSSFHKKLWMSAIFSPFGTVLRWQLSLLNGIWFRDSKLLKYFPFGTFFANISGCTISILAASVMIRLDGRSESADLWLYAIKIGFAGNLSTVSTFAKEIVLLSEKNRIGPAYFYAIVSMATCCLVGIILYVSIIKL